MLICQSRYEPSCDRHKRYSGSEGVFKILSTLMMSARSARRQMLKDIVPVVEAQRAKTSQIASSEQQAFTKPHAIHYV
jgi:hypothetical protein